MHRREQKPFNGLNLTASLCHGTSLFSQLRWPTILSFSPPRYSVSFSGLRYSLSVQRSGPRFSIFAHHDSSGFAIAIWTLLVVPPQWQLGRRFCYSDTFDNLTFMVSLRNYSSDFGAVIGHLRWPILSSFSPQWLFSLRSRYLASFGSIEYWLSF